LNEASGFAHHSQGVNILEPELLPVKYHLISLFGREVSSHHFVWNHYWRSFSAGGVSSRGISVED
jgi:hypothetical protein